MARIRSIKPDFWTDEKVVELSPWERLLFIGLWNFADDQGFIDDKPRRIKMQVFPGDDMAVTDVERMIGHLVAAGILDEYDSPIGPVLHVRNWERHQRVDRPSLPRFDADSLTSRRSERGTEGADSTSPRRDLDEPSRPSLDAEGKGREGKGYISSTSSPKRATVADDPDFARFWTAYPKKVAKGQARTAWKNATKKASADDIVAAVERYAVAVRGAEPRFIAHPATWLNGERWDDQPTSQGAQTTNVRAMLPASNAPVAIPPEERCPDHRGEIKDQCRWCRSLAIGRPQEIS